MRSAGPATPKGTLYRFRTRAVAGLAGMEAEPDLGLRLHALDPGPRHVAVLDVVSRKWLTTLTSAEETSTRVQVAFSAALDTEGLLGEADELATAALRAAIASGDRDRVAHLATA